MSSRLPDRAAPVDIRIVDPSTRAGGDPSDEWLADQAASVLVAALPPELRDDRFDHWQPPAELVAALGVADGAAVAYLGGSIDRGRLQLDALIASWLGEELATALLQRLYRSLMPSIVTAGPETIELWGKPAEPWHAALAAGEGFTELRALHQLRCPLPLQVEALATRPFVVGRDEARLLAVNNRAFASHPDQGGMTLQDLEEAEGQPWFEPEGIRLYDDPDDPERLAGFCWTKIHRPLADTEPPLGEIYAIGVDPDHHGRGLGKPMTAAGLEWLAGRGLTTGMLYVEADNEPALRTYAKLGFEQHRTDRAWHRRLDDRSDL